MLPPPLLIRGATVFDGSGAPGALHDLLLRDGLIAARGPDLEAPPGAEILDGRDCWLTPGFIDLHTHYDAEVELAPGLPESLRHGVTTIVLGSCGLGMTMGDPDDLADMFCRVEGIPRSVVAPLFRQIKTWDDPAAYLAHLDTLALGPNVASLLGHSCVRAAVLGMGRALDRAVVPTPAELSRMTAVLEDALDAGYIGLSVNTLPWDKMDGDRFRSRPTPSVFARWAEYTHLMAPLRRRDRVLQAVPNISTRWNVARFAWESLPLPGRPSLRTMLLTLADPRSDRLIVHVASWLARVLNGVLGARFRWQALPHVFDLYSDGLEVPLIEELRTGTQALHLADRPARAALLRDPAFRRRFASEWRRFFGKAWHRDLGEARVVSAPDASLSGKTFAEVARERGIPAVDAFLDLNAEHGDALRWVTVAANDRPDILRRIVAHPDVLIGFSDAGAHLRNMGFYNFPLRLLRLVRDAEIAGTPFMSVGRAVQRLTSEIADFLRLPAGRLRVGDRADGVLLDPRGLDSAVEELHEEEMTDFPGLRRLVRRNDAAVRAVIVGGAVVVQGGQPRADVGAARFGRVLRAALPTPSRPGGPGP